MVDGLAGEPTGDELATGFEPVRQESESESKLRHWQQDWALMGNDGRDDERQVDGQKYAQEAGTKHQLPGEQCLAGMKRGDDAEAVGDVH